MNEIATVFAWVDSIDTNNNSKGFLSWSPIDDVCLLNIIGVNGFTNTNLSNSLFDALYTRYGEDDPNIVSTPIVPLTILKHWFNTFARQIIIDELLPQLP